jgi:hypothetical protein
MKQDGTYIHSFVDASTKRVLVDTAAWEFGQDEGDLVLTLFQYRFSAASEKGYWATYPEVTALGSVVIVVDRDLGRRFVRRAQSSQRCQMDQP